MSETLVSDYRTVLHCIKLDENGNAYVEASQCSSCGAKITSEPLACPSCGRRGTLRSFRVSENGIVYTFSIVFRSYPGVQTPFISVVVDLDDGVTLKGVLRGVEPRPEAVPFGMRVKMVFDDALGRRDSEGHAYISYFFEPAAS